MGRAIGGVILGYIAMAAFVFLSFTLAYVAMGTERAFKPGSHDVSGLWLLVSFVLSIAAALLGGWVCAVIAPGSKAPMVLAGLVLILGLMLAVMTLNTPDPGPRAADVSSMDAMQKAKQPNWVAFANPIIGAVGVVMGAGLRKRR